MSLKVKVYNQAAEALKDLDLSAQIFGVKPSAELLHQAVVAQQANARQVLAHTKDRSEVAGSGKKPWKQKARVELVPVRCALLCGLAVVWFSDRVRNVILKRKSTRK